MNTSQLKELTTQNLTPKILMMPFPVQRPSGMLIMFPGGLFELQPLLMGALVLTNEKTEQ